MALVAREGAAAAWWSRLRPRDVLIVWFNDDDVWHERQCLHPVSGAVWIHLNADGDRVCEDLQGSAEGPSEARALEADWSMPKGIRKSIYRFASYPVNDAFKEHVRAGYRDDFQKLGGGLRQS
jgi:hypothetical protein